MGLITNEAWAGGCTQYPYSNTKLSGSLKHVRLSISRKTTTKVEGVKSLSELRNAKRLLCEEGHSA